MPEQLQKIIMNSHVIETRHVSRAFGKTEAVKDLNLKVRRGSIYGFLGRNGAGKTTAIKMLAGLLWPDQGEIEVRGVNPRNFTAEHRQRIGYLSEKQTLPPMMKVGKLLQFCSNFYPEWDSDLCDRILKLFRLDPGTKVKALSQGNARQVGLLLALAQRPDLLLLDEPAGGLDVVARREFLDQMLELIREEGKTVFFSSHILSDVERVADEIGILAQGTLRISEPLDRLKETVKQVRFYGFSQSTDGFEVPGAFRVKKNRDDVLVTLRVEDESLLQHLATKEKCQFEIRSLNLEDIFIEIAREF